MWITNSKKKKNIKKNICTCFLSISLSIRISSSSCSNWNKYFFPLQATIKNKHRSKAKRDVLKNRHSENFWKFIRKSLKYNPPLAKILRYWKRTLLYIFLGIFRNLWSLYRKHAYAFPTLFYVILNQNVRFVIYLTGSNIDSIFNIDPIQSNAVFPYPLKLQKTRGICFHGV